MTEDEFIAWLATQRGEFRLLDSGKIRHETAKICYCPLQRLTGLGMSYTVNARGSFGMSESLISAIIEASDYVTLIPSKYTPSARLRARMLDVLGLS